MQEIDMHQIEIFLMVARYQNISRAAQKLYISQPAISNWISKMEADCGIKLFNRTNRGVSLTPEGEILYARLDIAYHRFRVSVAEICRNDEEQKGLLRLGYLHRREIRDTAERAVGVFSSLCPEIEINGEMFNFHELRDKLLCDELDIVLSVSFDIAAYPEFEFRPLKPFCAFFAVSEDWKSRMAEGAGLSILNGKPLILEARTGLAGALAICEKNGFSPSDIRYVNSYILLSTLVARGAGFSIGGDFGEEDYHYPRPAFIPVPVGNEADVVAAWRKGKLSPEAEKFLQTLEKDTAGEQRPEDPSGSSAPKV